MKEKNCFYSFIKIIVYPFFMLLYHPKFVNRSSISDGLIMCGNHTSNLDGLLLVAASNRKIHFLAKIELFQGKLKNFFFTKMGFIPVDRKKKNGDALTKAEEYLNESKVVTIFPEGTINKTRDIVMPFKYGVVSLASKTKCSILPFAIVGKYNIIGKSVRVIFGEPYKLESSDLELENKLLMEKVIKLIKENK